MLKWFLASLKGQQYAGRNPDEGIKKPLNAFLGEVFIGQCGAGDDETKLIAEQVSHHPPVTACYLWNDQHGVRAEGYTRQEITFSGTVNIQQIGHAILHIDEYDEDYLIPLPNVKVKGILTGSPYPELQGSYSIVSSTGLMADIDFSGKGVLGVGGKRNHVRGSIYNPDDDKHRNPLFTIEGSWSESFETRDGSGQVIDTYDVTTARPTEFHTLPLDEQDPWESRRAWREVISSVQKGNMQGIADNKNALETAQRKLRKNPVTSEDNWKPLFFVDDRSRPAAEKLLTAVGQNLDVDSTRGVWRYDASAMSQLKRPFRGELTPLG